jgi:hypothetical protein
VTTQNDIFASFYLLLFFSQKRGQHGLRKTHKIGKFTSIIIIISLSYLLVIFFGEIEVCVDGVVWGVAMLVKNEMGGQINEML